jgi:hypothetical protein
MIKKSVLLFFSLCLSIIGITQQLNQAIVSAAGDVNKTDMLSLEWTLGEPMIESISSNKQVYTQGFHQPVKMTKYRPAKLVVKQEWFNVTILPNPVQTVCKAVIQRETFTKVYLELSDINGRPLINKTSKAKYEVIDFNLSSFSSGVYTLLIRNASGSLYKTFKIIKAL